MGIIHSNIESDDIEIIDEYTVAGGKVSVRVTYMFNYGMRSGPPLSCE